MRLLLLVCRPFVPARTHSSSRLSAFWRAVSLASSCAKPLLLLIEPRAVVALPRNAAAAIELENPFGGVVEEVAVVRHRDDRAGEALQELLEPFDALGIEMVRRFVEQQHVGLGEQQPAQRDAALLAARERTDLRVPRRQAQRVGRDLQLPVEVVAVRGEHDRFEFRLLGGQRVEVGVGFAVGGVDLVEPLAHGQQLGVRFFDRLAHGLAGIELRLLFEVADRQVRHRHRVAVDLGVDAGHDAQDRRFARPVEPQDADLRAGEKAQGDIFENLALRAARFCRPDAWCRRIGTRPRTLSRAGGALPGKGAVTVVRQTEEL